jgi:CheY-like chemotaxis protein
MNGYEAARQIRSQPWGKEMVLMAHTGWGQEEARRQTHDTGFDYHLTKPAPPLALESILADVTTRW